MKLIQQEIKEALQEHYKKYPDVDNQCLRYITKPSVASWLNSPVGSGRMPSSLKIFFVGLAILILLIAIII